MPLNWTFLSFHNLNTQTSCFTLDQHLDQLDLRLLDLDHPNASILTGQIHKLTENLRIINSTMRLVLGLGLASQKIPFDYHAIEARGDESPFLLENLLILKPLVIKDVFGGLGA